MLVFPRLKKEMKEYLFSPEKKDFEVCITCISFHFISET